MEIIRSCLSKWKGSFDFDFTFSFALKMEQPLWTNYMWALIFASLSKNNNNRLHCSSKHTHCDSIERWLMTESITAFYFQWTKKKNNNAHPTDVEPEKKTSKQQHAQIENDRTFYRTIYYFCLAPIHSNFFKCHFPSHYHYLAQDVISNHWNKLSDTILGTILKCMFRYKCYSSYMNRWEIKP